MLLALLLFQVLVLSLLRHPCGVEPGLHDIGVVLRPLPSAFEWVTHLVDPVLKIVDLLLIEAQRPQEGVGYRVLI